MKINQIQYPKKKRKSNDHVMRELSSTIGHDKEFETKMEMENMLVDLITLESNKKVIVAVEKDKKDVMEKQFNLGKYEQINPNWSAFFTSLRDHKTILEKY